MFFKLFLSFPFLTKVIFIIKVPLFIRLCLPLSLYMNLHLNAGAKVALFPAFPNFIQPFFISFS
jgi:hypothetical protein